MTEASSEYFRIFKVSSYYKHRVKWSNIKWIFQFILTNVDTFTQDTEHFHKPKKFLCALSWSVSTTLEAKGIYWSDLYHYKLVLPILGLYTQNIFCFWLFPLSTIFWYSSMLLDVSDLCSFLLWGTHTISSLYESTTVCLSILLFSNRNRLTDIWLTLFIMNKFDWIFL